MSRTPLDFLRDARDHARQASTCAVPDRDTFVNSETPIEAIYHLMILGEAFRNVSPSVRSLAPHIPWRLVTGMRDLLIHKYWRVDLATVHRVIVDELQPLVTAIDGLISTLEQDRP